MVLRCTLYGSAMFDTDSAFIFHPSGLRELRNMIPASQTTPVLSAEELRLIDSYWSACNYLAAGMIYLRANPLLREPLKPEHIKRRLLGHWGSDPGQSFVWVHLNRLIRKY